MNAAARRSRAHAIARPMRVAFAGGGTGGHIVPGLHVLAALAAAGREAELEDLVWFTSGRAVEERVFAAASASDLFARVERVPLAIEPHDGGAPTRARLALRTPPSVLRARTSLRVHRADVLLGLGGFTTLPAVLAARSLGIPVVLLEINAVRGAATRHLARFAARVLHAWRATLPIDGESARDRWIGPPLAPELAAQDTSDAAARRARAELGFDPDRALLLVLGGSQGSSALNAFVRTHVAALVDGGAQVLHQTGPAKLAEAAPARDGYRASGYVAPMHLALRAATVCLCRGGASTLAEVAAARVPVFVAPYPHHDDRHQERNAAQLGLGARVVPDERLDAALRDEILRSCRPDADRDRERMRDALEDAVPRLGAAEVWNALVDLGCTNVRSNDRAAEPMR